MKKISFLVALIGVTTALFVQAAQTKHALIPFKGIDLTGTFSCTVYDVRYGTFKTKLTLVMDKTQSYDRYASYKLNADAGAIGAFTGLAAADDHHVSLTFANKAVGKQDIATGTGAIFYKNKRIKLNFFYYELGSQGSNHGSEICI